MPPVTPSPSMSPAPKRSSGPAHGILIALAILCVAGFLVLFYKMDLNAKKTSQDVSALQGKVNTISTDLKNWMQANADVSGTPEEATAPASNNSVGGDVPSETANSLSFGPLSSDIKLTTATINFPFSAADLVSQAEECDSNINSAYFTELVKKFDGVKGTQYTFTYQKPSQGVGAFKVTVFPNMAKYQNLTDFRKEMDTCAGGAEYYPDLVNKNYIAFINSCGTGFSDGSGRPVGCEEAQKLIGPTLKLK